MIFAKCHPDRKHIAKSLCGSCYNDRYRRAFEKAPTKFPTCHPESPLYCKDMCESCYSKFRYYNHITKATCHPERRHKANGLCVSCYKIKTRYGVDYVWYKQQLEIQNHRCAICQKEKQLVIDHDHKTDKIRGLLCNECNRGLGQFEDSITTLQQAINYIKQTT